MSAQQTRQRRFTSATVRRARDMYGAGDAWTPTQIQRYLAGQGIVVHVATVRDWVIPGLAEDRRRRQNEATQRRRQRLEDAETQTPLLDRMRQLRGAGVSFGGVAIVMRLDWGLCLSADDARYWLRVGREPKQATA